MRETKKPRLLWIILLVALALRLIYGIFIFPSIKDPLHWDVDDGFDEIARNMLHGHGYALALDGAPNITRPPGYTFLLAGMYSVLGEEIDTGPRLIVVQSLLDTATCYLVYLLSMAILANPVAALISAAIYAIYPQMIVYCPRPFSEVPFVFLTVLLALVCVELFKSPRLWKAAVAGLLVGVLILFKEKLLLLSVFLAAALLWRYRQRLKRIVLPALVVLLVPYVVITPWTARCYMVTGRFLFTSRLGSAIVEGNIEELSGADRTVELLALDDSLVAAGQGADQQRPTGQERIDETLAGQDTLLTSAMGRLGKNPGEFVKRFFAKLFLFWYWGQPRVIVPNLLVQMPLVALGLVGLLLTFRRRDLLPLTSVILYFLLVHAAFVVRMRYSLPVMPHVIVLAGAALAWLVEKWRGNKVASDVGT